MKSKIIFLTLIVLLAACSAPTLAPTQPPVIAPTNIPIAATTAPTVAAQSINPAATPIAPTRAVTAPTLREKITLRDLPGVGRNPYTMVMLDGKVYVIATSSDNIAVIENDRVTKFIPANSRPTDIAVDPATKKIYFANNYDRTISIIENDRVTLTTSIGEMPDNLLFFENKLFVGLSSVGNILVLDPSTLKTTATIGIPKAFAIVHLAGDTVHHRIYASIYDTLVVIDSTTLKIITAFGAKGSYYTLAANPLNDSLLAAIYESDTSAQYLTAFDPLSGSQRARVKIGGDPRGIALTADGSRIYVANYFGNTVSVINARDLTTLATINVDTNPFGVALDESKQRLYVSSAHTDCVNVIDTQSNTLTATIPLGANVTAVATNESLNRVYFANASTDSIFVVQGNQVIKEINNVGRNPIDLARDEKNNRLIVANAADNTLSLVDETTFAVRTTQPITKYLSTVAVDAARGKIFAGDQVLDASTLAPTSQIKLQGYTLGMSIAPNFIRLNPSNNRMYVFASNGVPGSNGRQITYALDATTLQQRTTLSFGGNTNFISIDPDTNRVFIVGTNPMSFRSELGAYDANDSRVVTMTLNVRPDGLAYNPSTHHLFISQAAGVSQNPPPDNNTILVLDTNSWGKVAQWNMTVPGLIARLGNSIYVANGDDGTVMIIGDTNVPTPPSPTPTLTPTPYPTLLPLSTATLTRTPTRAPTTASSAALPLCKFPIASLGSQRWNADLAARIGCPIEAEHTTNFVTQAFDNGAMFWREEDKKIFVLFSDATKNWNQYDDTWNSAMSEDACPDLNVIATRIKPKRGFGKIWCEQSNVRSRIGLGTSAETSYTALTQKFERGQMFGGNLVNQVYTLLTTGGWQ